MSLMNEKEQRIAAIALMLFGAAAMIPFADDGYYLSLCVNIVMYAVLCTAWTLFSGPTHYISLATAAFFGIGTYSVGLGIDTLPFPLLVAIAAVASGVLAGLVGVATLRLSGVYFVIFTLGLAELVRQVVTWLQVKFLGSVGLYVFTDMTEKHIFWMLLALAAVVYITGWLVNRSRLGFALRIIGNDETVAPRIEGARRTGGVVVIVRRQGRHGVEQDRHGPMQLFTAAGKDQVLLAELDLLDPVAHAMKRCRAGRSDGIVHALDPEWRRQTG